MSRFTYAVPGDPTTISNPFSETFEAIDAATAVLVAQMVGRTA